MLLKWVTPALLAQSMSMLRSFWATTTTTKTTTTATTKRQLSTTIVNMLLTTLIISALFVQTTSGFRSIETNGDGRKLFGGYRITPKHCRGTKTLPSSDPRSTGPTICMFNHECAQRDGEVVGACMDGFLFGACCQVPSTHELASTLIMDAQNAYFQQHQQQKLQQPQQQMESTSEQTYASPGLAQTYANFDENQQQTLDKQPQQQQQHDELLPVSTDSYQEVSEHDIYAQENMDKVYQQLESSSIGYAVPPMAISESTPSNSYGNAEQTTVLSTNLAAEEQSVEHVTPEQDSQQQMDHSGQQQNENQSGSSSTSVEFEQEASQQVENDAAQTNDVTSDISKNSVEEPKQPQPPAIHVQKNKVQISSPSSPTQNDDFVLQMLNNFPPGADTGPVVFTTEVPMKIASSILEQTSSESSSFEEQPTTTQAVPIKVVTRPFKPQVIVEAVKRPSEQLRPVVNIQQQQQQQSVRPQQQKPQQQQQPQKPQQQSTRPQKPQQQATRPHQTKPQQNKPLKRKPEQPRPQQPRPQQAKPQQSIAQQQKPQASLAQQQYNQQQLDMQQMQQHEQQQKLQQQKLQQQKEQQQQKLQQQKQQQKLQQQQQEKQKLQQQQAELQQKYQQQQQIYEQQHQQEQQKLQQQQVEHQQKYQQQQQIYEQQHQQEQQKLQQQQQHDETSQQYQQPQLNYEQPEQQQQQQQPQHDEVQEQYQQPQQQQNQQQQQQYQQEQHDEVEPQASQYTQQQDESLKQQQQQQQDETETTAQQNMHHHNHLVLEGVEFTHSDITHPGADADLVEDDLQFSTGYGPQPVYVAAPQQQQQQQQQQTDDLLTAPAASPEDKYVLVQTISSEKKPETVANPTTVSAITTHVDSIESIILQLNNTNHGPSYNVVNPQTPSYNYDTAAPQNAYSESTTTTSTHRPDPPTPTKLSPAYYGESDTKRPEQTYTQSDQQDYVVTTTVNDLYNDNAEKVSDEVQEISPAQSNVYGTVQQPTAATTTVPNYSADGLDEHTMPPSGYNDINAQGAPQTSEFNKMPAVGIAYPVDMSYMDEDSNLEAAQPAYAQVSSSTEFYENHKQTAQAVPVYQRPTTSAIHQERPSSAYPGVVTVQNFNKPPQMSVYNQLPEEVAVSSHTTVQEDYVPSAAAYQQPQPEKLITTTTTQHYYESPAPTAASFAAQRPQYDAIPADSSSERPVLITASPKPRPKPSTQRPVKRPTNKTPKPQVNKQQIKQPASNYHQAPPQPVGSYNTPTVNTRKPVTQPVNTYNDPTYVSHVTKTKKPEVNTRRPITQPSNTYNEPAYVNSYTQTKKPEATTRRPVTQPVNSYNDNAYVSQYTQTKQPEPTTHKPVAQPPANNYNQNTFVSQITQTKPPNAQPTHSYGSVPQPINSYNQEATYNKKPASQPSATYGEQSNEDYQQPANDYYVEQAPQPALSYNQNQQVASSPTKQPNVAQKPATKQPVSTSYVTGPSSPRPSEPVDSYYDKVNLADDKLDAFIQSTAENILGSTPGNYQPPVYPNAVTPVHVQNIQRPQSSNLNNNKHKKPGFVAIKQTTKAPTSTIHITPKPSGVNLVTSSTWTQQQTAALDNNKYVSNAYPSSTAPPATYDSGAYIYNITTSAPAYTSQTHIISHDFEDPGYFNAEHLNNNQQASMVHPAFTQSSTEAIFAAPSDDKPAFPGYYGPTPTYPAFVVPGEKVGASVEEETYTSPNDFVNFPPVRNPNLNMSAVSSAVTSDLELSTPAFVEDAVLKNKMNTLVQKLVASLQGNFEALADMIDENNSSAAAPTSGYQTVGGGSTIATRKPTTKKPTRVGSTAKPKATTRKPLTRVSTKTPTKKTTISTRRPTTRRPTSAATSASTRRPTSRKPTRRVSISTTVPTTTTLGAARPVEEEIVDEEDEEDVNPSVNEIDQDATLSSYGAGGRKIQCGVRPHVKSGRIVGGKGSTFGAYPWQVLVRESTWLGLFTKNKCGGVLITNRYIITAAHCQPGFLASLVAVMGEFDISGDLESKRPVTKNVKRVIVHRQYDPATFENDLALLELDSPVQFDTHIVPICMPNDHADFTGRMATVTGWGRLKYGGGVPSVLQEVQVPIIENSVCQEMFHTAGHNKKILNSFLCAGYANGQKDSCEGDSGGPLVLQRPDGRYELAGTVSHGIKCAAPYLPGVYMRTTFYKPWLRSITGVK